MKVCPKCKMKINDDDKICKFCGAAQMTENSPMKKYEEVKEKKKNEITPARKKARRKENFEYLINLILLVGFVVIISFIILTFFGPEFKEMINDISNFFKNIIKNK